MEQYMKSFVFFLYYTDCHCYSDLNFTDRQSFTFLGDIFTEVVNGKHLGPTCAVICYPHVVNYHVWKRQRILIVFQVKRCAT